MKERIEVKWRVLIDLIENILHDNRHLKGAVIGIGGGSVTVNLLKYMPRVSLYGVGLWCKEDEGKKKKFFRRLAQARSWSKANERITMCEIDDLYGMGLDFVVVDPENLNDRLYAAFEAVKSGGLILGYGAENEAVVEALNESYTVEILGPSKDFCWWFQKQVVEEEKEIEE